MTTPAIHWGFHGLWVTRAKRACFFALAFLTIPGIAAAQQAPSQATATVDIVAGKPLVIVRITNSSLKPLSAWEVHVRSTDSMGVSSDQYVTEDAAMDLSAGKPGRGPIAPGGSREFRYGVAAVPTMAAVELKMLLFEDGSFEGSTSERAFIFKERERNATAVARWMPILENAARDASPQARNALVAKLAADPSFQVEPTDAFAEGLRQTVLSQLSNNATESVSESSARLTAFVQQLRALQTRALRHRDR